MYNVLVLLRSKFNLLGTTFYRFGFFFSIMPQKKFFQKDHTYLDKCGYWSIGRFVFYWLPDYRKMSDWP